MPPSSKIGQAYEGIFIVIEESDNTSNIPATKIDVNATKSIQTTEIVDDLVEPDDLYVTIE